eukprot:CAMPEP_0178439686 /NCGR_PEP_ID=MMETSP0689_2-20121128/36306_1 /TAXON_ID=160604 /ORGANISM="Amphidinium massartii, Strain CS-259" /LENGTH=555 /DNA_ID=CAMNT_0020062267 /DNA_START=39 /DNA_END=1702 /DNA_ORIENTATION=+
MGPPGKDKYGGKGGGWGGGALSPTVPQSDALGGGYGSNPKRQRLNNSTPPPPPNPGGLFSSAEGKGCGAWSSDGAQGRRPPGKGASFSWQSSNGCKGQGFGKGSMEASGPGGMKGMCGKGADFCGGGMPLNAAMSKAPALGGPLFGATGPGPGSLPQPLARPPMQQLGPGPMPPVMGGPGGVFGLGPGPAPCPGPSAGQLPLPIPVSLARATASIVPVSSKPGGGTANNKQIAMQFLTADRAKQAEMLRDPAVAKAILQTLGESKGQAAGAAPPPPAGPPPPGAPPPVGFPLAGGLLSIPGLLGAASALPGLGAPAPPADGAKPAWVGNMKLSRSNRKQLPTQATLLHGKVELVELALRSAAGTGGMLNVSHRVPFDDVARRTPGAVLQFIPATVNEQLQYGEYIQYFRSKVRAGVAPLDKVQALYLIPPADETAALLAALTTAGVPPLPKNCLLGIIADAPASGVLTADKPAAIANSAAPAAASQPAAGSADSAKKAAKETEEKASRPDEAGAKGAEKEEGDGNEDDEGQGQEFSKEALLDLFSNPELLKSLQG